MLKNGKPRNEGAYLLGRVGLTDAEVAARVGCSRAQVTNYRACKLKPRRGNRIGLQRELKIPPDSWDRPYVEQPAPPPAGFVGPVGAVEMQNFVNDLVRSVHAPGSDATPYERAKVLRSTTSTLQLLGKLTGDTVVLTEAKILRLPAWQSLKRKILDALRPWPEAIHAVGKALGEENGCD